MKIFLLKKFSAFILEFSVVLFFLINCTWTVPRVFWIKESSLFRQTLMASLISEWLEENGFEQSASTIKIESGLKSYLPKSIVNVSLYTQDSQMTASDPV